MKITEQNFIKQIIQGNEKALEYCMLHYGGLVKTVVRRHLGDLSRFEDECINDVFFAVWQHADSYRSDKNSFANWIAGVSRLKALDCRRRYTRHLLEVSFDDTVKDTANEREDPGTPELAVLEEEISRETREMLDCLRPADRELFIRLYMEEEDVESVSRSTGMSKAVIYNHVSRGKKKLRRQFLAQTGKGE